MKHRFVLSVIGTMLIAAVAWASISLNSSRSNIYRVTYPTDLASKSQVAQMLAALDKLGRTDEAKLKQWLPANFKRYGIDGNRVKKLVIMSPDKDLKEIAIILLTNPADEPRARATTVKSSKSNSSD
ncbi:MAG: hypothetical protein ACXWHG_14735 [Thermoanaerobaculia bacterium]